MAGRVSTKKRGNGQGSISYNKSKNLWVAQYYANGKRKTIYSKNKTKALEKMTVAQSAIISGLYFEPSKLTVGEWLNIWLKEYMLNKRAPKTVENHDNIIRNHIIPNIGDFRISELKPFQVQKMYNAVVEKLSPRTVQLVHVTLHASLEQAVKNDMLIRNVSKSCTLPKQAQSKSRALSIEEQTKFVNFIKGNQYELAFLFCLYAGLRRGEALALKWQDIETDNLLININKTVSRVKTINPLDGERKTQIIIKEPKSKNSNRSIPISAKLVPYIKRHKAKKMLISIALGRSFENDDFVFTDSKGNPFDGGSMNTQFHKIANDIFSEDATVHTLRHTYVTRGAESGVSMKAMQELCGHSKIGLTADIYTHISNEFKKQEVSKMEVIL